jgi:hypothetical protein
MGHSSARGEGYFQKSEAKVRATPGGFQADGGGEDEGGKIRALGKELAVPVSALYRWKQQGEERLAAGTGISERSGPAAGAGTGEEGQGVRGSDRAEDPGTGFFRGCLAKDQGVTPAEKQLWRDSLYTEIRGWMESQGGLGIVRMCQLTE